MTETPEDLLDLWEKQAGVVERYIAAKDYRRFRLAYRKAEQYSRKIQFHLKHGNTEPFLNQKGRVKELVERWDRIAVEQIKPWMNETKDKIDKVHSRRKNTKKINKAYGYIGKRAGKSLRMKAR